MLATIKLNSLFTFLLRNLVLYLGVPSITNKKLGQVTWIFWKSKHPPLEAFHFSKCPLTADNNQLEHIYGILHLHSYKVARVFPFIRSTKKVSGQVFCSCTFASLEYLLWHMPITPVFFLSICTLHSWFCCKLWLIPDINPFVNPFDCFGFPVVCLHLLWHALYLLWMEFHPCLYIYIYTGFAFCSRLIKCKFCSVSVVWRLVNKLFTFYLEAYCFFRFPFFPFLIWYASCYWCRLWYMICSFAPLWFTLRFAFLG